MTPILSPPLSVFSTLRSRLPRFSVMLLLVCCSGLVNAAATAQPPNAPVRFVTQHFPPYSYIEQGDVAGPARALIDRVCQAMQQDCRHQLLPWARSQMLVKKGLVEGMYVIGWNPERSRVLHFSAPLFSTEYGFFIRGDDPLDQIDPESLDGYQVAVMAPSNTLNSLQALQQQGHRFEIIEVTDSDTAFRLLAAGRVDTVYSNRDVGLALIRHAAQSQELHYAVAHRRLDYYVGFSPAQVSQDWLDAFNQQLDKQRQQGETARILKQHGLR